MKSLTTCRSFRCLDLVAALIASKTRQRAIWQLWLAEYLCFGSVGVTLISEMLANVKSVWPVFVRRDLDGKLYAVANVRNEAVSRPPIALSNAV